MPSHHPSHNSKYNKNRKGIRNGDGSEEAESFFQMLVNTAGVAIWWSDPEDMDFKYLSPEAEKIFGYTVEEAIQPGFRNKLLHPDDRDWVMEYCSLATREGHPHQLEYRIITKEGKIRTVRDIVRLTYKQGKPKARIGVITDISIHMLTMEELQASNERFFRAFHNFPIPATISRVKDSRLIDVNKNFLLASGFERNEILGKTAFELKGWTSLSERDEILKMLKNNQRVDKYPIVMIDAFGRSRNLLISAELFESNGETCLLLMFYDITEQIKAEDRLQAINRELEIFMYKSSHNLKGPVASVKGLVHLLKEGGDESNKIEYLDLMERSVLGLENTLEELMDIARVKQGKLKIESVDLKQTLEDIGLKLQFMKEWAGIHYTFTVEQQHSFYTDANLLYSILQNLIENAVKYKHEKNNPKVEVEAEVGLRQTKISVKDNGIGIFPEQQERIFEMFYRASEIGSGTGLGLYIVRNAVQKLGGSISVESRPLEGSCFRISLPNLLPGRQ